MPFEYFRIFVGAKNKYSVLTDTHIYVLLALVFFTLIRGWSFYSKRKGQAHLRLLSVNAHAGSDQSYI